MGSPPVPPITQRNGLSIPGRKSSKSSNSDAFAIMMQASQGKTKLPIRSTFDRGKQKDVVPASASLEEDSQKRNMTGATVKNGGSSSKLKSRMRPREKPKVEPVLKLSVSPEPDPGTDDHEISEQSGGDREWVMGHETLDSIPSVEKPSLPVTEPPPVTEMPQQRESESGATDGSQCDFDPTITDIQPLELPGEQIHRPPQNASSIEKLPEAELEHFSPFTSQDISEQALADSAQDVELQEAHLPTESTENPLTSQDISEKTLTESAQDVEIQEETHLPIESTEIEYSQPAESSSTDAREASQIPEAVVPVPKAGSRRGGRSGQKKSISTTIPVGRMTRSAASKLKTTEPSVARSG